MTREHAFCQFYQVTLHKKQTEVNYSVLKKDKSVTAALKFYLNKVIA